MCAALNFFRLSAKCVCCSAVEKRGREASALRKLACVCGEQTFYVELRWSRRRGVAACRATSEAVKQLSAAFLTTPIRNPKEMLREELSRSRTRLTGFAALVALPVRNQPACLHIVVSVASRTGRCR